MSKTCKTCGKETDLPFHTCDHTPDRRKEKAEYARKWRAQNPQQYLQGVRAWRKRNPRYWRGPTLVKLLNTAIKNSNEGSKVWMMAGKSYEAWLEMGIMTERGNVWAFALVAELKNGCVLEPIRHWRQFNLNKASQVKAFLEPGNFRIVKKT